MSEETKNENNEEVEKTSEDVETEEEAEESAELEDAEETEESSDEAADEDDSDDGDEETADEDDSDDSEEADDSEETADEDDSDGGDEEAADEDDSDDDSDSDDGDEEVADEEAADEDDPDDVADDDAAEHFGEADSPVRRSGSPSVDEIDVEEGDLDVEDGEEDPHLGLLTGDHVEGVAAFFDHPDHLLYAAAQTRDSSYEAFDAFSPFPIHGMDDALGVGRSWIPWVTFGAGCAGFSTAVGLQFGIMGFDWPMNFGGKPFIAWPSFVPIMFELTVLFAGVITGLVMLKAAGCFQKPFIIDTEITNDRFVLWISATDENFDREGVIEFMKELNPSEIRTIKKDA